MYFKGTSRKNPKTGNWAGYYRLVESYLNNEDRVCHRTILNLGYLEHLSAEQLNGIQLALTERAAGKPSLFIHEDPVVVQHIDLFWERIVHEKRIDVTVEGIEKKKKLIDAETMEHRNVREIGVEWLCYQALEQLGIKDFLKGAGWDEEPSALALTHIISRASHPASEYSTVRWLKESSAVTELTGYPLDRITKDKLYNVSLKLFDLKDKLEQHLSVRTNELFNLEDSIVLYDLTNSYFEGVKADSCLAKYGRSKEKRSDAKLVVLALVVNPEGFLKFSSVFEGNKADSKSLPDIVDGLHKQTAFGDQMPTVIMDAGISTKENLLLLTKRGYKYVCVSRTQLKDYQEVKGANPKTIVTKNKQELTLQRVTAKDKTDYYLKVYSPGKQLKEASMKNSFESKLEAELQKAASALTKRGGIKKVEPVNRRIGKILKTYPSVSKYYTITVDADKKSGIVSSIKWAKQPGKHEVAEENLGVYFIQTNIPIDNECHLWQTYNTIRNIESCFRCLKSDLAIRPLHHRTDTNTMAHIHLALLAYWVVNTIRYQLKPRGISSDWTEIIRIGNTQKIITTTGQNQYGELIAVRKCSQPNKSLKNIYDTLQYKGTPFTKRKSIVHKLET